jgi:hypothetical protein
MLFPAVTKCCRQSCGMKIGLAAPAPSRASWPAAPTVEIVFGREVRRARLFGPRALSRRLKFLSDALSDQYYDSSANALLKTKVIPDLLRSNPPDMSLEALVKFVTATPQGPHKFALMLLQEVKQLLAMDRDEQWDGANLPCDPSMKPAASAVIAIIVLYN